MEHIERANEFEIDFAWVTESIIQLHAQDAYHRISRSPVIVYGSPYGKHLSQWRPPPSRCVCLLCQLHGIGCLTLGHLSFNLSWFGNMYAPPVTSIGTFSFTISSSAPQLLTFSHFLRKLQWARNLPLLRGATSAASSPVDSCASTL
jgi:hypothetical protein